MDEPTSSLSHKDVRRLFRAIRRLRDRGVAVVYISHFLDEVREIAGWVSPVPGGVGPMTVATLLSNVIEAGEGRV